MVRSTQPSIKLKRAYEDASPEDGARLLVERLWPRGVSKEDAKIDRWFKQLAPSSTLRKWYGHDPDRWPEFRRRYEVELADADKEEMNALIETCREGTATFVFAARDEKRNSAVVLRDFVLKKLQAG